jgi:hypothetical protein
MALEHLKAYKFVPHTYKSVHDLIDSKVIQTMSSSQLERLKIYFNLSELDSNLPLSALSAACASLQKSKVSDLSWQARLCCINAQSETKLRQDCLKVIEVLSCDPSVLAVIIKNKPNDMALALRVLRKYFRHNHLSKEIYLAISYLMYN